MRKYYTALVYYGGSGGEEVAQRTRLKNMNYDNFGYNYHFPRLPPGIVVNMD